jgi:hypothetical protein
MNPAVEQRQPGPVAIEKAVESLIAGMNARRTGRYRVASPPKRLERAGSVRAGNVKGAVVVGVDNEGPFVDGSPTGPAPNKDMANESVEEIA